MFIIGLTGGLGTGKSTVAKMFHELGARVIDADQIVHQLLKSKGTCFHRIIEVFSRDILSKGRINRKRLAKIIFDQPKMRFKLEHILHPEVRRVIKNKVQQYRRGNRTSILVLDIPLLYESNWHRQMDFTVVVISTKDQQVRRAMSRLKISQKEALQRIQAQMSLRTKASLADYVIDNSKTKLKTKKHVQNIYFEILNKHKGEKNDE